MSQDQLDDLNNIGLQIASGGSVGMEDGKIKAGVNFRMTDEAIGEITGRNMQRQAMNEQRSAVAKAALDAEEERKRALKTKQETDLQQSLSTSAAMRMSSTAASSNSSFFLPSTNSEFASDFLGV